MRAIESGLRGGEMEQMGLVKSSTQFWQTGWDQKCWPSRKSRPPTGNARNEIAASSPRSIFSCRNCEQRSSDPQEHFFAAVSMRGPRRRRCQSMSAAKRRGFLRLPCPLCEVEFRLRCKSTVRLAACSPIQNARD